MIKAFSPSFSLGLVNLIAQLMERDIFQNFKNLEGHVCQLKLFKG